MLSESGADGYLAALDCQNGELLWRTERRKTIHRDSGTCRTPTVKAIGGHTTIIVWGYEDISGYDPTTGQELWSHALGNLAEIGNPVARMVSDDHCLYLAGTDL